MVTNFKKTIFPKYWRRVTFWFKFVQVLASKYKLRFILILASLAIFALFVRNFIPKLPIFSNNLVIGVIGEYRFDNLPQSLTQLYSSGLTKFEKNGKVVPSLAKTWETENGKKIKFTLGDNLFWQDGKQLKATDIQFKLSNVEIRVLNGNTIEFVLVDTYSPYPANLTRPVFRKNSQIGTGPYKLAKIKRNGETLREMMLAPVKENLPQITIRFFPNSQSAVNEFKAGRVGIFFNLMRLNGLENWKMAKIEKTLEPTRLVAVFYNTQDQLLENVKVRKALDLVIDRSKFENLAFGPYPPTSWVALEERPVFNSKKAEKLLADEKITGGKITILAPAIFTDLATEIAKNWQSLGFEVEFTKIDKIPQNFQVAIFGLEIPQDPDQYSFWHSTQSQTLTKIQDPKLDKLLEDGRKLINSEERKTRYQELQGELRELVPASFLFFPDRYIVINKNSAKKIGQIKKLFPEFPIN